MFDSYGGQLFRSYKRIASTPRSALRHTPVADAVVDLYTCVHASAFKGTHGSSFTDTIWQLRRALGCANEREDELEDHQ